MAAIENITKLITTLITLSLISERAINWIKLYFGQSGKKLPFFTKREEDISKRTNDPKLNAARERKILGLNITVGIIIAFFAHANLFEILRSENPAEMLGWNKVEWPKELSDQIMLIFSDIVGCTLSGLCMSMGSKFWHDVLDKIAIKKDPKQQMVEKGSGSGQPNEPVEEK